ncbi:MAG: acetyl-CoA carboxylase biotin carboxyl carrier protein subunit [Proteobacteria bacterium]|nr:MAG: acetyl-CoA carboxylase biotin carboxyl carrier protein subunit [Pseudomonadota bacterium]
MNYEVTEKKGDTKTVGLVEISEGQFEITIDGRTVHVDAAKSGKTIYSILEDGKQFEVIIDDNGGHGFDVLVGGQLFHLEARDERARLLASTAKVVVSGPQRVEAEMPGKVVKIVSPVGTAVAEGQGVIILEAMKMENEIKSPFEGTITDLGVSEGQTVESGALLFVVTPPEKPEGA